MKRTVKLEPEVAIAKIRAGEDVFLNLPDVAKCVGWQLNDFLPYVLSGELAAYVLERDPARGIKVGVKSNDMIAFMVRHNLSLVARTRH